MLKALGVPTRLHHRQMARQVGPFIGEVVFKAVAKARLRLEMHDAYDVVVSHQRLHLVGIGDVDAFKGEAVYTRKGREPRFFQGGVIIIIDDVDANHALAPRQQSVRDGVAYKPCGACYEDGGWHLKQYPQLQKQNLRGRMSLIKQ